MIKKLFGRSMEQLPLSKNIDAATPSIYVPAADAVVGYRGFHDETDEAIRAREWTERQIASQTIKQAARELDTH